MVLVEELEGGRALALLSADLYLQHNNFGRVKIGFDPRCVRP